MAAGAAAALGHAPFGLWYVALLGFGALTFCVARARTPRRAFTAAWLGGVGYFGVGLHWIVEPFLVDAAVHGWMAPFALVLMAGGLALFWGAAGWVAARIGGPVALGWALCLSLAELLRGHVFTGFPWALPAYIWTDTDIRMTAALWGPYGLTALTLLAVALPFAARNGAARAGMVVASLVAVAALWLTGTIWDAHTIPRPGGRVLMVHPNVPQNEKWDPDRAFSHVERQIGYTAEGADAPDLELVIWPESAIPYPLDMAGSVLDAATAAAGVPVLTGINRRDGGDWFNGAVLAEAGGAVAGTYDKVHLVPFGEYIPFRLDFLRAMAARSSYGFSAGEAVEPIETPLGSALVMICYEAIFPGHIRRSATRPDVLIQITNDGWFGTFAGPYQHLQQAQFRAAETGLPLIRVANSGVSAMIDARGEIKVRVALGEDGATSAQLPRALEATPYWRMGDLPILLILSVTVLLTILSRRRRSIANADAME